MNDTVSIAMFGFIPVVLVLFLFLPPWRAALAGMLIAWMFLPIAEYRIHGWPDYTKMSATCGVVFIAVAMFDFRRVVSFRPAWIDAPMLAFCLSPFISGVANGLGIHEGLSAIFAQAITWGAPYAIGRLYFNDLQRLRELAIGVFAGGLLYVPFCFFELAQGPILHKLLYGYAQPDLDVEPRFGILRPMVFMESGLMLAVWLAAASVLGLWLWRSHALTLRGRTQLTWLVPFPIIATVLMRSVNGWVLLTLGVLLLVVTIVSPSKWWLVVVLALIPGYLAVRATGLWSGEQIVPIAALIHSSKGHSVLYRLESENIVVANIHGHGLFGYGRQPAAFSDYPLTLYHGTTVSPDSLWIIVLAYFGAAGLISWAACLLVPLLAFVRRVPAQRWLDADVGPAAGLTVILMLSTVDHLANAMINPIFMLIAGGLASLSPGIRLPIRFSDLGANGRPFVQ